MLVHFPSNSCVLVKLQCQPDWFGIHLGIGGATSVCVALPRSLGDPCSFLACTVLLLLFAATVSYVPVLLPGVCLPWSQPTINSGP